MLQLVRVYYNTVHDMIRRDTITMLRRTDVMFTGWHNSTWQREVRRELFHIPTNRTVGTVEVYGNYDDIEVSSGSFLWASWNSPEVRVDMADLPLLTETT